MSEVPSVSSRRLSDEECRILLAAEEERLYMNGNGRYEIDQEIRPDRRTRENLSKRGLIATVYKSGTYSPARKHPSVVYRITAKGKSALRREITKRVEGRR